MDTDPSPLPPDPLPPAALLVRTGAYLVPTPLLLAALAAGLPPPQPATDMPPWCALPWVRAAR